MRALRLFFFYTIPIFISKGFKYVISGISYVFKWIFHLPLQVFDKIYSAIETSYALVLKVP